MNRQDKELQDVKGPESGDGAKECESIKEDSPKDNQEISDRVKEKHSEESMKEEHQEIMNKDEEKTETENEIKINIGDEDVSVREVRFKEELTRQNPKITISEPMNSPCESEAKPPEPKGRCPIYFGIKSYIHDFYQPPDKEILRDAELIQEDDFQFLVEPGKRRWRCSHWLRTGLWVGINLMLIGIIAILVGHLTPFRNPIVDQRDDFYVLDRWAVTFNNRLIICQIAGLVVFTCGGLVVMLTLLVASYQQEQARSYYVMAATVVPETFVGSPRVGWSGHRIPLSGSVSSVQPSIAPKHQIPQRIWFHLNQTRYPRGSGFT